MTLLVLIVVCVAVFTWLGLREQREAKGVCSPAWREDYARWEGRLR